MRSVRESANGFRCYRFLFYAEKSRNFAVCVDLYKKEIIRKLGGKWKKSENTAGS